VLNASGIGAYSVTRTDWKCGDAASLASIVTFESDSFDATFVDERGWRKRCFDNIAHKCNSFTTEYAHDDDDHYHNQNDQTTNGRDCNQQKCQRELIGIARLVKKYNSQLLIISVVEHY
jgi:hypothetical protein